LPKTLSKLFAFFAGCFLICSCMSEQNAKIRFHGHRGCRGLLPENTLPAFVHAWRNGTPVLELDIVLSSDSELVVSHDPFMHSEICAMPDGSPILPEDEMSFNIFRMTSKEIKQFPCGTFPHPRFPQQMQHLSHKPLLSELVDSIRALAIKENRPLPEWNIEVKSRPEWDGVYHPHPDDYAMLFLRELGKIHFESDVYIQCFDHRILNALHKLAPRLKLVYLSEDEGKDIRTKLSELNFKPFGFSPNYTLVNREMLNYCADHGLKLFVWTVNDAAEMERLYEMGVTEIITDYPVKEKPAPDEPALQ
jgi:glycerophosphoryl diester phosphodiesterase